MLIVTTPAPDPTLLSDSEIAAAVGKGVSATPQELRALNARVSEMLAAACGVVRGGAVFLTLRAETLTETFRLRSTPESLFLSRSPVIEIVSIAEGDAALTVDDGYEIDGINSVLRLHSGSPACWGCERTTVVYRAGWETVPNDLKELASKLAIAIWSERGRDPSLGSIDIPGLMSETYRYGRPDDPLITAEIMQGLANGGYLNRQAMVG